MLPSKKTLESAFPSKGAELRRLLEGKAKPADYPQTAEWLKQCFNQPSKVEQVMSAANEIIEGFGTEAIFGSRIKWPDFEYVNLGDTYITTLGYDYLTERYVVCSWGDWIERAERNGRHYE